MSIQSVRTSVPRRDRSSAILDEAKGMVRSTLDRLAARKGSPTRTEAMAAFARASGVSAGTLENLLRDRLKAVSAADYAAIREACVVEITHEIGALERELRRARSAGIGSGAGAADLRAAEAALETARRLIARTPGGE